MSLIISIQKPTELGPSGLLSRCKVSEMRTALQGSSQLQFSLCKIPGEALGLSARRMATCVWLFFVCEHRHSFVCLPFSLEG